MIACPDCETTHMGYSPCGMTALERMRSIGLGPGATPTKTRRRYYDQEAVANVFGPDSEAQLMDATEGHGAVERRADGALVDMHGEVLRGKDREKFTRIGPEV